MLKKKTKQLFWFRPAKTAVCNRYLILLSIYLNPVSDYFLITAGDLPEIVFDSMQRRRGVLRNVNRKSYSADTLFLLPVSFVLTLFPFPSVSQRTAGALFPPSRPFPNPINSCGFREQNNSMHAFPFMHSWHQAETSPPTACYYLTHAPVCLLYVNKVVSTHTHTCKHTLKHPYTPLSTKQPQ